jgi:hypothetical protein
MASLNSLVRETWQRPGSVADPLEVQVDNGLGDGTIRSLCDGPRFPIVSYFIGGGYDGGGGFPGRGSPLAGAFSLSKAVLV